MGNRATANRATGQPGNRETGQPGNRAGGAVARFADRLRGQTGTRKMLLLILKINLISFKFLMNINKKTKINYKI
jgi:hypothetical protein